MGWISHNKTWSSFPAEARIFGVVGDQAREEMGWLCPSNVITGASGLGIAFTVGTRVGTWFCLAWNGWAVSTHVPNPPAASSAAPPPMRIWRRVIPVVPGCSVILPPVGVSAGVIGVAAGPSGDPNGAIPVGGIAWLKYVVSNGVPVKALWSPATKARAEGGRCAGSLAR